MTRRLTQVLVLVAFAGLITYDVIIRIEPTPDDTVSCVVWSWVTQHPFVAVAFGVILGHWVWPPRDSVPSYGPAALVVWGVILAAADWLGWLPGMPAIIPFCVGLLLGGWLWGPTPADVRK